MTIKAYAKAKINELITKVSFRYECPVCTEKQLLFCSVWTKKEKFHRFELKEKVYGETCNHFVKPVLIFRECVKCLEDEYVFCKNKKVLPLALLDIEVKEAKIPLIIRGIAWDGFTYIAECPFCGRVAEFYELGEGIKEKVRSGCRHYKYFDNYFRVPFFCFVPDGSWYPVL